jgi:phosphoribosyl-AMP cyclohydrolase
MNQEEKKLIKSPRELKYDDKGLIPAIIQDAATGEVLMLAYMNDASLKKTLEIKKTCFWSRSRQTYWVKGETSGHYQYVKSIAYDCDRDTLLIKVRQVGAACHTGKRSCFYRKLKIKK